MVLLRLTEQDTKIIEECAVGGALWAKPLCGLMEGLNDVDPEEDRAYVIRSAFEAQCGGAGMFQFLPLESALSCKLEAFYSYLK